MKQRILTTPELALIAGTRVVLGMGVGLLLAGRFNAAHRRAVGGTLFAVGVLSTIPLAIRVFARAPHDHSDAPSRAPRRAFAGFAAPSAAAPPAG